MRLFSSPREDIRVMANTFKNVFKPYVFLRQERFWVFLGCPRNILAHSQNKTLKVSREFVIRMKESVSHTILIIPPCESLLAPSSHR
jgi:hypothetical protein